MDSLANSRVPFKEFLTTGDFHILCHMTVLCHTYFAMNDLKFAGGLCQNTDGRLVGIHARQSFCENFSTLIPASNCILFLHK